MVEGRDREKERVRERERARDAERERERERESACELSELSGLFASCQGVEAERH